MSNLEREFETLWKQIAPHLPEPEREYKFMNTRKFRFDFAWIQPRVAVEIDGGTWVTGRHVTGSGFSRDCDKYNAATAMGWRVYHFTSDQLRRDPIRCINFVIDALDAIPFYSPQEQPWDT